MRPVLTRRADKPREEGGSLDDPLVGVEVGEIDMNGETVPAASGGSGGQAIGGQFDRADRGRADMPCEIFEFPSGSTMATVV